MQPFKATKIKIKYLAYLAILFFLQGCRDRKSNYLCNQCLSPLTLWVPIPLRQGVLGTTTCDKVCQWLATGLWFSPSTPISSTNKFHRHDITPILLKVASNIPLYFSGMLTATQILLLHGLKKVVFSHISSDWCISP
jgi:hypothetical protein